MYLLLLLVVVIKQHEVQFNVSLQQHNSMDISTDGSNFALYLISNADQERHPNNTISSFTITTDSPLQFQYGTWNCALRSISFPTRLITMDDRVDNNKTFVEKLPTTTSLTLRTKTIQYPRDVGYSYTENDNGEYTTTDVPLHLFPDTDRTPLQNHMKLEPLSAILNGAFNDITVKKFMRIQRATSAILALIIMDGAQSVFNQEIELGWLMHHCNSVDDLLNVLNLAITQTKFRPSRDNEDNGEHDYARFVKTMDGKITLSVKDSCTFFLILR